MSDTPEAPRELSEHDLEWLRVRYSYALRDLTANLLRIVAGAGKPYEVVTQAAAFLNAFVDYEPHMSWAERTDGPRATLSIDEDYRDFDERWICEAEEEIIVGALRIAASRLLGQQTQESAGQSKMLHGINRREKALADYRARANAPRKKAP